MVHTLGELIDLCIEICQEVPKLVKVTPDAYLADILAQREVDATQTEFVQETVYCYIRYEPLVSKLVSGFFDLNSSSIVRSDRHRFEVLNLYAIWKFNQLGDDGFRNIILSQLPHKMCVWLEFLFSADTLDGWFTDVCSTYFDINYVKSTLVPAMKSRTPVVFGVLADMFQRDPALASTSKFARQKKDSLAQSSTSASQIETFKDEQVLSDEGDDVSTQMLLETTSRLADIARNAATLPTSIVTVAEPFNLSQPRANRRRAPLALPRQVPFSPFKAQPVPPIIFETPSLSELEKMHKEQRLKTLEETRAKYASGAEGPAVIERSKMAEQKIKERRATAMERERLALEQAERIKEMKAQKLAEELENARQDGGTVIKMTAAALLREDALYRKLQEEALAELERYASELKDSSEHDRWKEEFARAEDAKARELIAQRKQELSRAAAEANAAVQRKQEEIRLQVAQQREELAKLEEQRRKEMQMELSQKRQIREDVVASRANVSLRVNEVASRNAAKAEALRRESERAKRALAAQREEELAERRELIKQVQAMERIASAQTKQPKKIDPTESGASGLLDEMSLAELRARLVELKLQRETEEQEKREKIMAERQLRQARLDAIARNHIDLREHLRNKNNTRRLLVQQDKIVQQEVAEKRDKEVQEMVAERAKIRETSRREEALLFARRVKESMEQSAFFRANTEALARNRAQNLILSAERAALKSAEAERRASEETENSKQTAKWQRKITKRREQRSRQQLRRTYDEDLELKKALHLQEIEEDFMHRKSTAEQVRLRHINSAAAKRVHSSDSTITSLSRQNTEGNLYDNLESSSLVAGSFSALEGQMTLRSSLTAAAATSSPLTSDSRTIEALAYARELKSQRSSRKRDTRNDQERSSISAAGVAVASSSM